MGKIVLTPSTSALQNEWRDQLGAVFYHMAACYGPPCTIPGCNEMRRSIPHAQNCTDKNCQEIACITMNRIYCEIWSRFLHGY